MINLQPENCKSYRKAEFHYFQSSRSSLLPCRVCLPRHVFDPHVSNSKTFLYPRVAILVVQSSELRMQSGWHAVIAAKKSHVNPVHVLWTTLRHSNCTWSDLKKHWNHVSTWSFATWRREDGERGDTHVQTRVTYGSKVIPYLLWR